MKKLIAILIALLILTAPATALARGHCSGRNCYDLCSVRNCTRKGNHRHSGKTYRAHYRGDGHRYCTRRC